MVTKMFSFASAILLLLSTDVFAAYDAAKTAFSLPSGLIQRDQRVQATIQHTGEIIQNFWFGLSFASNAKTSIGWPDEYDNTCLVWQATR